MPKKAQTSIFFPHILVPKSSALRGDLPLQKQWNFPFELFHNFLYSQYYLHHLGPLCTKIITLLGLHPSVTFARQNIRLIWHLNLWRLKHPLTMSLAERESEVLKFDTQEREDKHETMRILNILITLQFYLIKGSE